MEAKEKGVVLDADAEAFLADVECAAHYDDSLAITTTTAFEVSHEDAYDSDVEEAPHAATSFMANLTGTSTERAPAMTLIFTQSGELFLSRYRSRGIANEIIEWVILALFVEMMKCLRNVW
nr:hypothetical protein [Tanacetum cinerariifolium]